MRYIVGLTVAKLFININFLLQLIKIVLSLLLYIHIFQEYTIFRKQF